MDIQFALSIVGAFAGLSSVVVASAVFVITRNRENYGHLQERMAAYVSSEMLMAIKRLWEHYRKYGDSEFAEKYIGVMLEEDRKMRSMSPSAMLDFQAVTLHYQRRIVTRFWREVAMLLKFNLIPRNVAFRVWYREDVEIVDKVLIPIENRLADYHSLSHVSPKSDLLYYIAGIKDKFYH